MDMYMEHRSFEQGKVHALIYTHIGRYHVTNPRYSLTNMQKHEYIDHQGLYAYDVQTNHTITSAVQITSVVIM